MKTCGSQVMYNYVWFMHILKVTEHLGGSFQESYCCAQYVRAISMKLSPNNKVNGESSGILSRQTVISQ